MTQLIHRAVANGTHWVSIPHLRKNLLIGCPPNAVKHLVAQGLLRHPDHGRTPPSSSDATPLDPLHAMAAHGLHAVVLADRHWHADGPANMAEFPMLHALYALPQEARPILVGHPEQLRAQTEYIMRGHYGLQSEAELRELGGLSTAQARQVMRMKLFFSGGTQYRADELFDLRPLVGAAPIELLPNVWLQRVAPSVLRIDHGGEHLEIDLHQRVGPLRPTVELVPRACPPTGFAVTHIGQGDGWSPDVPSMSSLITWQGKHYLVDAGPEALLCLRALGLCVHDIEGIFQTHCHDDHIAGLLDLMRSSRRIRFFAPAMVSASVMRKLCALAVMPQRDVAQYFAVEDLALERWNDIDGLRVRPFLSPHPVETTAYTFLARTAGGTRSYSHLADLCSLQHLREMAEGSQPVLTSASLRRVLQNYWRPASVKKIDIGGGLVHGDARDFRGDHSGKIVLAHTSRVLDADELAIGQRLAFGERDELLAWTAQERTQHMVHRLQTVWPNVPQAALAPWLADGVLHLPSHTLIHEHLDHVLVLISGRVLSHDPDQGRFRTLSAGHRLGEADALGLATQSGLCHRTQSPVQALRLSHRDYLSWIDTWGLRGSLALLRPAWHHFAFHPALCHGIEAPLLDQLVLHARPIQVRDRADWKIPARLLANMPLVHRCQLALKHGGDTVQATAQPSALSDLLAAA